MCRKIILLIIFLTSLFTFFILPRSVHAIEVTSEGLAVDVEVNAKNVPDGSIITINEGKYELSTIPYDPSIAGVISYHPAAQFSSGEKNKVPMVAYGRAKVRVSTINGSIKNGDLITTSTIPGVGMKSKENGYIIGLALEDYDEKDPNKTDTIYVSLHLNFGMLASTVRENLISSLQRGARAPFVSPLNTLRYLVAAFIAIFSFIAGFWFFGRVSSRGVEAIGRNPLARQFIILSVVFNVAITVVVMLAGVALAYLVLVI